MMIIGRNIKQCIHMTCTPSKIPRIEEEVKIF